MTATHYPLSVLSSGDELDDGDQVFHPLICNN